MNIVLIGFMGSGKSAVGRALARHLGADFLDTDAEIEREAGRSIPQIFAEEGEAAFRARETAALARLASALPGSGAYVLATGGGTPLREENARLLKRIGRLVWLTASPEIVLERVGHSLDQRPLLDAYRQDPGTRIAGLLTEREPHYAALADVRIDPAPRATPDAVAAQIARELLSNEAPCEQVIPRKQR